MNTINRRKDQTGFTLIELIIAIAVIAILVAIAIPVYGNVQQRARENAVAKTAQIGESVGVAALIDDDSSTTLLSAQQAINSQGDKISVVIIPSPVDPMRVCATASWLGSETVAPVTRGFMCTGGPSTDNPNDDNDGNDGGDNPGGGGGGDDDSNDDGNDGDGSNGDGPGGSNDNPGHLNGSEGITFEMGPADYYTNVVDGGTTYGAEAVIRYQGLTGSVPFAYELNGAPINLSSRPGDHVGEITMSTGITGRIQTALCPTQVGLDPKKRTGRSDCFVAIDFTNGIEGLPNDQLTMSGKMRDGVFVISIEQV